MWPPDALRFYEELAEDNTTAFFDANRARYHEHVRGPMEELLDAAFDEFGDAKVFRPNRDTRFSKDKSPYKLTCAARVGRGWFVSLSAEGLHAGGGMYEPSRDQLARYRAAVEDERRGAELERIAAGLTADGHELLGQELKRGPRGTDPDHPRIALLKHTRVFAIQHWPPGPWLHTPEARERVFTCWRELRPLLDWLDAEVGPPQDRPR
jgi:uncharacterized protein (TIGR02453 family)